MYDLYKPSHRIKCGACGCEYDCTLSNGCPQCHFGETRTVTKCTTDYFEGKLKSL